MRRVSVVQLHPGRPQPRLQPASRRPRTSGEPVDEQIPDSWPVLGALKNHPLLPLADCYSRGAVAAAMRFERARAEIGDDVCAQLLHLSRTSGQSFTRLAETYYQARVSYGDDVCAQLLHQSQTSGHSFEDILWMYGMALTFDAERKRTLAPKPAASVTSRVAAPRRRSGNGYRPAHTRRTPSASSSNG